MDSSWPTLSHDNNHTGRSQYSTVNNTGMELWQIPVGEPWGSPVIDKNGTIYFGTFGSIDYLYAISSNGTVKWQVCVQISTTPAIAADGTIYSGTWNDTECGFIAVSPKGKLKWRFDVAQSFSPAIAPDGTIYFGTSEGAGFGNVYALNPDGTMKWRFITRVMIMGCPAIGADGTIYIGSGDCNLYALNPNGTVRWQYLTSGYIKGSATIAPDGTIYVPSFDSNLYALYPNGTLRWKVFTGDVVEAAGVALGADGTIYVGTEKLRAFSSDGILKWCTDLQGYIYGSVPAVSSDGTIFVTAGGSLVAVNPDGTVRWRSIISTAQSQSSPCIGPDDRVYVGSHCRLHAFGLGEPKKIVFLEPTPGHLYLFNHDLGPTRHNNTVILGSALFTVKVYDQEDLRYAVFSFGGLSSSLSSPPFEWNINVYDYPKKLIGDTVSITAYYKGGATWTVSMPVVYFHLF